MIGAVGGFGFDRVGGIIVVFRKVFFETVWLLKKRYFKMVRLCSFFLEVV